MTTMTGLQSQTSSVANPSASQPQSASTSALTSLATEHGPDLYDYHLSAYTVDTSNENENHHTRRDSYEDFIYSSDSQPNPLPSQNSSHSFPQSFSQSSLSNGRSPHKERENTYLQTTRLAQLNRKSSNISSTGTPDSLLDFYGQDSGGIGDMVYGNGEAAHDTATDQERWIHRDKLAQIESKELQAAGFIVSPQRPKTANKQKRDANHDAVVSNTIHGQPRQRSRPPQPNRQNPDENSSWDKPSPDDATSLHNDGSLSKGSSRIPLSKNSRVPIPLDYISRDTPVVRRKSNGWAGEDDGIAYPRTRDRSRSTTRVMDEPTTIDEPPPIKSNIQPSPSKKLNTRNLTSPSTRKPTQTAIKKRANSGARDLSRNGGRESAASGNTSTSTTSTNKRPEGDPPWLATMYKPDPRLPPDQQLLPTVAKRLQQEAWEKEGKFGNAYDSSFRPMNNESPIRSIEARDSSPSPDPVTTYSPSKQKGENIHLKAEPEKVDEWPLQIAKKITNERPAIVTSGGGGGASYSTMPRILSQPNPPISSPVLSQSARQDTPTMRSQMMSVAAAKGNEARKGNEPGKVAKDKGCGCCVVM